MVRRGPCPYGVPSLVGDTDLHTDTGEWAFYLIVINLKLNSNSNTDLVVTILDSTVLE